MRAPANLARWGMSKPRQARPTPPPRAPALVTRRAFALVAGAAIAAAAACDDSPTSPQPPGDCYPDCYGGVATATADAGDAGGRSSHVKADASVNAADSAARSDTDATATEAGVDARPDAKDAADASDDGG